MPSVNLLMTQLRPLLFLVDANLIDQQLPAFKLERISSDFKTVSISGLINRSKHFHLAKNENDEIAFYMDSLSAEVYFNEKTKPEILEWLGPPDSVLYFKNKLDYYLYTLSANNKGCNSHFSYGIPTPFPKSFSKPNPGDVVSIEFICLQNCIYLNPIDKIEEVTIKYLKISFEP